MFAITYALTKILSQSIQAVVTKYQIDSVVYKQQK